MTPWAPVTPVQADDDPDTGQLWSPVEVSTCEELQGINDNSAGSYVLANDIDCNGTSFQTISNSFTGTLNGQGYTVSHLNASVFSSASSAIISNLYIANAQITAGSGTRGILVGNLSNSLVANVHIEGAIVATQGFTPIGGLAGSSYGTAIQRSSAATTVEIMSGQTVFGGLLGEAQTSRILNSYSVTTLVNGGGSIEHVGGLISTDYGSSIVNSYAAGSFAALYPNVHEAGGLVWYGASGTQVTNSFSTVEGSGDCGSSSCSGLVTMGYDGLDLSTDYFDQTASGTSECSAQDGVVCHAVNADGSEPEYFDNNNINAPMSEWDFTNIWMTTLGLPTLRPASNLPVGTVEDLVANIGSTTSIGLNWSMPASTGSAPLLGEAVYYQKAGETTWTLSNATAFNPGSPPEDNFGGTNVLMSDLLPATQYTFKVVLYNQNGDYSVATVQGVTATPGTVVVNTCQDLQDMDADLTAIYEVGRNIDCSNTINWNDGLGFSPIGCSSGNPFIGTLQGNNYTISNLYIADSCSYIAFFAVTAQALVQDITFSNPTLVGPPDNMFKAGITGFDYLGTFNNVHVVGDFTADQQGIHAGLIGISYGGTKVSQASFTGPVATTSAQPFFGGIIGQAANYAEKPVTITNSYVQTDVTATQADPSDDPSAVGGLVAYFLGGDLLVTNSYAALTLTQPDVTKPLILGGLLGLWAPSDESPASFATNSFASTQADINPSIDKGVGGLVGLVNIEGEGVVDLPGNYFDADRIGTTQCAGEFLDTGFFTATCNPVSGQPGYFENNSTNPPLNSWDFENIWQTTSTFPVFGVNRPINPIPPERFQPKHTDDPVPSVHTATSTAGSSDEKPATTVGGSDNDTTTGSGAAAEGGIIGRLKELFDRIPVVVLASFPYLLFILLLLVVVGLLIEMVRQRNRLHQLNILLEEQRAVAEKRDTFWHLAANYLRAPVTLLMGGVDLLTLGKSQSTETDRLATMSKRLQTKVTTIMERIEKSRSLQDIHAPAVEESRKIWLSAGFWLPICVVAGLIVLTNYLARTWRGLEVGTINLTIQVLVFLLVSLALYWALSLFGKANRERRAAELLLVEQEHALDRARMKLMRETAAELDADVSGVQLSLNKLPDGSEAKPIMQEGANRLRHIIDSFQLLISAQNHQLGTLSPAGAVTPLGKVLSTSLADLQPEIAAKNLTIEAPRKLNLRVPGSIDLNEQLLSSVLANAVAFSPRGGTITITTEQVEDGSTALTLTDRGSGITATEEEHIFQPFTKADGQAALRLDHEGLGISLYLDRQLMDYLGGNIIIHSIPEQGTTVKLQWPSRAKARVTTGSSVPSRATTL